LASQQGESCWPTVALENGPDVYIRAFVLPSHFATLPCYLAPAQLDPLATPV